MANKSGKPELKGKIVDGGTIGKKLVIKLPLESQEDFDKAIRSDTMNIRSFNIPTVCEMLDDVKTGKDGKYNAVARNNAKMVINLDDLTEQPGKTVNGTAVSLTSFTDEATNKPMISTEIDVGAVAHRSFEARKDNAAKKGLKAPDPKSEGRANISYTMTNAQNGVPGMSLESMQKNVANVAQQRYILTSSSSKPNANIPTKADCEAVAKIAFDTYNEVIAEAMKKGGIKGTYKMDKESGKLTTEFITDDKGNPKGAVDLSGFGFKNASIDGATVIACDMSKVDPDKRSEINKALVAVNDTYALRLSQNINGSKTLSANAKNLGNLLSMNAYTTNPPIPGSDDKSRLLFIQPATQADMQPYARSLVDAYEVATHRDYNGNFVKAEDRYSKEILDNAKAIGEYFSDGEDRSKVKAIQLNGDMLKSATDKVLTGNTKVAELQRIEEGTKKAVEDVQTQLGD